MRTLAAAAAVLLLAACSFNHSAGSKVPDPEVRLDQTSSMPTAAEYMTGNIPVSFRLSVTNRATIPITLRHVDVTSVGEAGGYTIRQTTVPFNVTLPPGASDAVDFTVTALATGNNVTGSNEPVTIRVISAYDSSEGALQTVVIRQVSGMH